jgi:hypothetical protein
MERGVTLRNLGGDLDGFPDIGRGERSFGFHRLVENETPLVRLLRGLPAFFLLRHGALLRVGIAELDIQ